MAHGHKYKISWTKNESCFISDGHKYKHSWTKNESIHGQKMRVFLFRMDTFFISDGHKYKITFWKMRVVYVWYRFLYFHSSEKTWFRFQGFHVFHPWKTRDFRSKISRFGNSEWEQTSDLGNENHVFSMCETNEILGNEITFFRWVKRQN